MTALQGNRNTRKKFTPCFFSDGFSRKPASFSRVHLSCSHSVRETDLSQGACHESDRRGTGAILKSCRQGYPIMLLSGYLEEHPEKARDIRSAIGGRCEHCSIGISG